MNGCETQSNKVCRRCKVEKPVEGFHNSKDSKDGKQPECKACQKERMSTPEMKAKRKRYAWLSCLKRFSITEDQYNELFRRQLGLCAICHQPDSTKLAVDHDHLCCDGDFSCGKCIRGLLCKKCNMGIGLLRDDPQIVLNAALYLQRAEIG